MPLPLPGRFDGFGEGEFGGIPFGEQVPSDYVELEPIPLTDDLERLSGSRVIDYRFDKLGEITKDNGEVINEAYLGTLDGVKPSGSLSFQYNASIKGGGKMEVQDIGQEQPDWLTIRIRPVARMAIPRDPEPFREVPLGVYIVSTWISNWDSTGMYWDVDLLDKNAILDQDIVTNDQGHPITYTLKEGDNVIRAVKELIESTGESSAAIEPAPVEAGWSITWDAGKTKLTIINDMLAAASYFSLRVNNFGQYHVVKYDSPEEREPVYQVLAPFVDGKLMLPDFLHNSDVYSIPNRFVVITPGTAEQEAMVAAAVNTDPDSPYSYQSRGRWITEIARKVEAVDQESLQNIAQNRLEASTQVTGKINVRHPILPELSVNNTLRFRVEKAGIDSLVSVSTTDIPFDPTAVSSTRLHQVIEFKNTDFGNQQGP